VPGSGVYGLLTKAGGAGWKTRDGSVVVEKETGASYVYQNGQLHPALNYSSALLAAGKPRGHLPRVQQLDVRRTARGHHRHSRRPELAARPGPHVGMPWTLCAGHAPIRAAPPAPRSRCSSARRHRGTTLAAEQGLLVTDPVAKTTWLIETATVPGQARHQRHPMALRRPGHPAPAGAAWLNGLPQGATSTRSPSTAPGARCPAARTRPGTSVTC